MTYEPNCIERLEQNRGPRNKPTQLQPSAVEQRNPNQLYENGHFNRFLGK